MPSTENTAYAEQLQGENEAFSPTITAGRVKELWEEGSKASKTAQHEYWINHAFVGGNQWLWYNPATNSLAELARDPDRVRITVNQLWPSSRTLVSKVVSRPLVWDVPPTAADDSTIAAAMTSESILDSLTIEHDLEDVREDLTWAVWKGGTAAIAIEWDSELGDPVGFLPDGTPLKQGDTVETALSVVDFVVQAGARNAEKAMYWIKSTAMPPEEVQDTYDLDYLPAADATSALTPFQAKLMADHYGHGMENVDLTRVFTYYERPSKRNAQGQMCVVVADEIVAAGPWPFPFKDRLNLAVVRETRTGHSWTGITVLSAARSVQMGLNQSWSSIIEHMKLAGNARLFVPQSVMDMIQELTDLPGELVPYPDGETPPQWTAPPQMPAWWIEQPAALSAEIDRLLGVHDVSRGEAPVNIESGVGLAILIEQDSTPIGKLTKEIARAFGRAGHMILEIYQENVIETRQSVIKTPGQPAQTVAWNGGTLQGQTNALVPVDAVMPRSRAQSLEFAKMGVQMGLISTLEQFVKAAEMPDQRDLLEAMSPDVAKARAENHAMALGQPEVPATFDLHAAHIQEHLTFMKGPRWKTLPPQVQEIFVLHNQAHEVMDAENMARMQGKAMTSPFLAAAADKNGVVMPPLPAPAGGPGGGPAPAANSPVPASTDPGKKTGNAIAAGREAREGFKSSPETVTGGIPN